MSNDEMNKMYKEEDMPTQFRIDKKIPIAIIFVIVFQTFGFIWSAAKITSNVESNIQNIAEGKEDIRSLADALTAVNTNLTQSLLLKQSIDGSRREADKLYRSYHELDVRVRDIEKKR